MKIVYIYCWLFWQKYAVIIKEVLYLEVAAICLQMPMQFDLN